MLRRTKIKWEEIANISGATDGTFCVETSPAGTASLLARRPKGDYPGLRAQGDLTVPQAVLVLPGRVMPMPIDRILTLIGLRFREQLERYDIELNSLQK
jgi:hypothetical protein